MAALWGRFERERLDGAGIRSVFGASEGANLSHGDLLLLLSKSATIAALMAFFERRNDRPAALARSRMAD